MLMGCVSIGWVPFCVYGPPSAIPNAPADPTKQAISNARRHRTIGIVWNFKLELLRVSGRLGGIVAPRNPSL